MTEILVRKNKYIRLRIAKVGCTYRADISFNKYYYNEKTPRYYEMNFEVFHPYDYSSDEETFEMAKEWLYEELKRLQDNVNLKEVSE